MLRRIFDVMLIPADDARLESRLCDLERAVRSDRAHDSARCVERMLCVMERAIAG